jgi:hypothetical protein
MMVGVEVVRVSGAWRWMEDVVVVGCGDGGGEGGHDRRVAGGGE